MADFGNAKAALEESLLYATGSKEPRLSSEVVACGWWVVILLKQKW